MKMIKLAREIHENAVAHGWWDRDVRMCEIFDLIIAEWSEALEEYRAGRGMLWYRCWDGERECKGRVNCEQIIFCDEKYQKHRKPEGIAVELIDGCIRIIDFMEKFGMTPESVCPKMIPKSPWDVPELICNLHRMTVRAYDSSDTQRRLIHILATVFGWLIAQGYEPEALIREKEEYNKTRPYRHGGKVI